MTFNNPAPWTKRSISITSKFLCLCQGYTLPFHIFNNTSMFIHILKPLSQLVWYKLSKDRSKSFKQIQQLMIITMKNDRLSLHKMVTGLHRIAAVNRCCQNSTLPPPVRDSFTTVCQFSYWTIMSSRSLYSALMEFYNISFMIMLSLYGTCISIMYNIKHHRMAYIIQQNSLSQLLYCRGKMQQHCLTIIQYLLLKMIESYSGSWRSWEAWQTCSTFLSHKSWNSWFCWNTPFSFWAWRS